MSTIALLAMLPRIKMLLYFEIIRNIMKLS